MKGIEERALSCLGKGFDVTSDFRIEYCKGDSPLVSINEDKKRDISVPGFGTLQDVSVDVTCDKGDRIRHQSDILNFNQEQAEGETMEEKMEEEKGGQVKTGDGNGMWVDPVEASPTDKARQKQRPFRSHYSLPCLRIGLYFLFSSSCRIWSLEALIVSSHRKSD